MNSSFGTTVARHRRPHFRHCLASGPLADQLCTSRFGEREISTTIYWGLLKQPDNQKPTCQSSTWWTDHMPSRILLTCPLVHTRVIHSKGPSRVRLKTAGQAT